MRNVSVRAFQREEAETVAAWAYAPPYDIYDGNPGQAEDYLAIDAEGFGFYAIADENSHEVIGFCCFGPEARVTGQEPLEATVDIGGGVRPDLVGRGLASEVFPLILEFARSRFETTQLRTAVASFNERSTHLCLAAGFTLVRRFDGPGREFQELLRPA